MRAFSSQVLAALALLVFSPTIMRVFAFAPRAGSIVSSSGALVNRRAVLASRLAFADAPKTPRAVRSMAMIFDKIFGNNPGPPDVANYYGVLEGAAREQGEAAIAGEVPATSKAGHTIATFAGGCFWGLELAFQRVPGVVETSVGYTQGAQERPTYSGVCSGATGHTEAVQVYYNPEEVSFTQLCNVFFERTNPTTVNGQGNDFGTQYRTGVYTHTDQQMIEAQTVFTELKGKYSKPIATELKPAQVYWPAEKYHQQYLEKGGRFSSPQSAEKGCTDTIRCYG